MRKLIWNCSILIITATFISIAVLSFKYKNVFFLNTKEKNALTETFMIQHALESILNHSIFKPFKTIEEKNGNISDLIPSDSFTQDFYIRDAVSGKLLTAQEKNPEAGNALLDRVAPPCIKNAIYSLNNDNYYVSCQQYNNQNIFIGFQKSFLIKALIQYLSQNYPADRQPRIHDLFIENKNIFINIKPQSATAEELLIKQSNALLNNNQYFRMFWDGYQVFSEKITSATNSFLYFFYNPQVQLQPVLIQENILNITLILLGLLLFLLSFDFSFLFKTKTAINLEKNEQLLPKEYIKRDLPELRELISTITSQEKSITEYIDIDEKSTIPEPVIKHTLSKLELYDSEEGSVTNSSTLIELNSSAKHNATRMVDLLNQFEDINYILSCNKENNEMYDILAIGKTKNEFSYKIPADKFLLPQLLDDKQILLSSEAGKTTVIRKILQPSFINPLGIEAAIIVRTNLDNYMLALFGETVDENIANEILTKL